MKSKFVAVSLSLLLSFAVCESFAQQTPPQKIEKAESTANKKIAQTKNGDVNTVMPMVAIAGEIYKSSDGHYLVVPETGSNVLYSKDGVKFVEYYGLRAGDYYRKAFDDAGQKRQYWYRHDLIVLGGEQIGRRIFSGTEADGEVVVLKGENFVLSESVLKQLKLQPVDILNNPQVRTFGWNLVYGGRLLTRIKDPIQGVVVSLPRRVNNPDKLYHLPDDRLVYLRANENGTFNLYLGAAGSLMRAISIGKVEHNGGTTCIHSEEGVLCAPDEPAAQPASWSFSKNDMKTERIVRLYDYDISESPEGIRLSPSATPAAVP